RHALTHPSASRRRHTTSTRDWSSDVCSSDLTPPRPRPAPPTPPKKPGPPKPALPAPPKRPPARAKNKVSPLQAGGLAYGSRRAEIGRASRRGRGGRWGGGGGGVAEGVGAEKG